MTQPQDLLSRMAQEAAASLSDYICDLFVRRLTDAQLTERRKAGAYRNIRPQDLKGYHQARGK